MIIEIIISFCIEVLVVVIVYTIKKCVKTKIKIILKNKQIKKLNKNILYRSIQF